MRSVDHLPTPFYHPVDAIIEDAETDEWDDALDQESRGVHVDDDVEVVQPQIRGRGHGVGCVGVVAGVDGDELDLEELGDVEDDGEGDDGEEVAGDPAPGVDALAAVVVLDGPPDGAVALEGEGDGGVDGAAEDEVVELVEEVAEGELVGLVEPGKKGS